MGIIEFLIVLAAFLTAMSLIYWTIRLGIGPVPTSRRVSETVYLCLPHRVNGEIIELGCGWGHLIRILKRKYPDKAVTGYERSPVPRWVTAGLCRVSVHGSDFFNADLSKAGLLVCYLYPRAMERMAQELLPKIPSGCIIITHTFALPGLEPETIRQSGDLYRTPVYFYRKP